MTPFFKVSTNEIMVLFDDLVTKTLDLLQKNDYSVRLFVFKLPLDFDYDETVRKDNNGSFH